LFVIAVLGHWVEHAVQLAQVHAWDVPRRHSHGVLGMRWPWLAESEALHFWYAIGMLAGLILFASRMTGGARVVWLLAIVSQTWHQFEHALLVWQAQTGTHLFGAPRRTSVVQYVTGVERIELHFFYNLVATGLMCMSLLVSYAARSRRSIRQGRRKRPSHMLWEADRPTGEAS